MTHRSRQGRPGTRYAVDDGAGLVVLVADAEGVVPIASDREARVADALRLPPSKPKPKPTKETD